MDLLTTRVQNIIREAAGIQSASQLLQTGDQPEKREGHQGTVSLLLAYLKG